MEGYLYGEEEPTRPCPYCKAICEADFVDIGVGYQQCGPYHCLNCGASEIGCHDEPKELTEREKETGWYAPGAEPGSSANVINGQIVGFKQMRETYKRHFTGNPLWHDKKYVDNWWKDIRKPIKQPPPTEGGDE